VLFRSCYDEGKRAAESLFFDYSRMYGVDVRIARIFNTYGPRMAENDGRVVSTFILQALRGEPITMFGDGSQTRSFCFVSDMIRGLTTLMESGDEVADPCNLGNPQEFTIAELATKIGHILEREIRIEYRVLPQDDPTRRCPDISKARQQLGWQPEVNLEDGLRKTIPYFNNLLAKKRSLPRRQHREILAQGMAEPAVPVGGLGVWPPLVDASPQPGTSRSALISRLK